MAEDPHYYVAGYSVEDDPYSQPNGVLINNFGIDNTRDLEEIEAESAALAIQELLKQPPPQEFSVLSLQKIHYEIFCDVYPWAGEFRKVDIAKGDTLFEANTSISSKLDELFAAAKSKNFFSGLSQQDFAQAAGEFLVELNRIHPFREGNGRTQRTLLSQMALRAGYSIGWEGISNDAMKRACVDGLEGNPSTMRRLLNVYLGPAPEELKKTWERLTDPTEDGVAMVKGRAKEARAKYSDKQAEPEKKSKKNS